MKIIIPTTAALLLAGCATVDTDRLDALAAGRCTNAEQRIAQLEATADLYQVDDLTERLRRARRLAEIWCAPDAAAPIVPVPSVPPDDPVTGGG